MKYAMKKCLAALLALCLLCACAALAEESYTYDEPEEDPVVDELIAVDDLAVTEGLSEEWLNILLLGTDSRTSARYTRTDTMIVLSVNQATGQIKMASIMRDTWVEIPEHGGAKLNAACVYGGPELTVRCVNENFGMNIQYYALLNMQGMVDLVDSLGGVRMDVSKAESEAINKLLSDDANSGDENTRFTTSPVSAGSQVLLNGKQALAYARIRSLDSDYARTGRQRAVLTAVAREVQQLDPLSLTGIAVNMLQYVETNLTLEEIMTLVTVFTKVDFDTLEELRLPVDDTFDAGMANGTWSIRPDFEQNTALLHAFIYGGE